MPHPEHAGSTPTCGAVQEVPRGSGSPEEVAAADDHGHLDASQVRLGNLHGHLTQHLGVDPKAHLALQRLPCAARGSERASRLLRAGGAARLGARAALA